MRPRQSLRWASLQRAAQVRLIYLFRNACQPRAHAQCMLQHPATARAPQRTLCHWQASDDLTVIEACTTSTHSPTVFGLSAVLVPAPSPPPPPLAVVIPTTIAVPIPTVVDPVAVPAPAISPASAASAASSAAAAAGTSRDRLLQSVILFCQTVHRDGGHCTANKRRREPSAHAQCPFATHRRSRVRRGFSSCFCRRWRCSRCSSRR